MGEQTLSLKNRKTTILKSQSIRMLQTHVKNDIYNKYCLIHNSILVLAKKIFKGFYHIWAWRPCWSCDPTHLYKFSFPFSLKFSYELW